MDKRAWVRRWAVPGVLMAVVLALGIHSAQQMRTVRALRTQVASQQQRAMLEVLSTLSDIETRLSKLLVSAGATQGEKLLGDIVRQAEDAQDNLSQLPLRHEAVAGTIKFVNQLGDYAGVLSQNITQGRPLSNQDLTQLEGMLANCAQLNQQLRSVENDIVTGKALGEAERIFWTDSIEQPPPIEQVTGKTNGIEYPSLVYDGPFSDGRHNGAPLALAGLESITQEQAMAIATEFVGKQRVRQVSAGVRTQGIIPAFGVAVDTTDGVLNVQVTEQGGKILWIMPEMAAYGQGLDAGQCAVKAYEFLTEKGFGHMEPNYWQTYEGLCVVNFAAVQDGVLLYPDLIKVQVRMDTGAVVGLEANNYLMNHHPRTTTASVITQEEAAELVSDRLSIDRVRLCVIPLDTGEKLCYEFGGAWSGNYYLVYIDAIEQREVNILRIIDTEGGRLSV